MKRTSTYLRMAALLVSLLTGAANGYGGLPPMMMREQTKAEAAWAYADSLMAELSEEEMLAQLIMPMVFPKDDVTARSEWDKMVSKGFGGVLWQKGTPEVQLQLTNRMRTRAKIPMLVAMDGEWGLSMRLSGTIRWPRNVVVGATGNLATAFEYGRATAEEARRMGIHANFAPVADVNNNPDNPVIGTRSFGSDPTQVSKMVLAYAQGLESMGVLSVAKHFPGHGDTNVDSHKALPVIRHNRERLNKVELLPFYSYIKAGLGGMMTTHLTVPALDPTNSAASASYAITTELLQQEFGFEGLVFTDGLEMRGIIEATKGKSVAVEVFKAGNDILVDPISPYQALSDLKDALRVGDIERSEVERRCRKVLAWKYLLGVNDRTDIPSARLSEDLNSPKSLELRSRIYEEAMTLTKNNGALVPLSKRGSQALLRYGGNRVGTLLEVLKNRRNTASFSLSGTAGSSNSKTYQQLRNSDLIIIAVTSERARPDSEMVRLARDKEVVLLFMTSPYVARHFDEVIAHAKAVAFGYDATISAQRAMGKALTGERPFMGSLPVELDGLFNSGSGLGTDAGAVAYTKPEEVGFDSRILSRIDQIANEGISRGAYPGCQVLVARHGKIVYNKAFGHKDSAKKEPNSTATLYDLASITKAAVTTPLMMIAEDEGKIRTQDTLGKHLTYLKGSNKEQIKISQLLHHTAGMPAVISFYLNLIDSDSYTSPLITYRRQTGFPTQIARKAWARGGFKYDEELVSRQQSAEFPIRFAEGYYLSNSVRELMRQEIRDAGLRSRSYRYSDIDFLLLQDALESAYGSPLDQLFEEKIARPLGLERLTFTPLNRFDKREIAEGQNDRFLRRQTLRGDVDDEAAAMLGGVSGNAGLFGSAEALFPLLQMILDKGVYKDRRYIQSKTVDKFTTARHGSSPYALGFDRHRGKGKRGNVADVAPISTYGHTGFTGTCFWIDPQNEIVYIFLSNRVAPKRWNTALSRLNIRTRIQEVIYQSLK
ncbi:MAG: glycoside hydrolase family 3 N-terminal domain-containing protein [Porphyromonas sp.]|nr:glycoside hydrolase family 3 N-terminal domain-containing protein [Porphyromonas sp.]